VTTDYPHNQKPLDRITHISAVVRGFADRDHVQMGSEVVALLGVALGGVLSLLGTLVLDVRRSRREDSHRWDEPQLEATVDYVTTVKLVARHARWIQESDDPSSETELRQQLVAAEQARSLAFERLALLGSRNLIERGIATNEALWAMEVASRNGELIPTEDWNGRDTRWRRALTEFQSAARAEIGIDPDVPGFGTGTIERFRNSSPQRN